MKPIKFIDKILTKKDFKNFGYQTGLELGVANGYFSSFLLSNSQFNQLFSIDQWAGDRGHDDKEYAQAEHALAQFGQRSTVIRSAFENALPQFENDFFDFIFIDGYAHNGQDEGKTIYAWWDKLKPGGFFGGHNYHQEHFPLTFKHVNEFVEKYGLQLYTTQEEKGYRSWYVFKKLNFIKNKKKVSNKSVIIIGNGASPRGKKLGAWIDSFDVVVRFNEFFIDGFEEDIGTKTTILYTAIDHLTDGRLKLPWEKVIHHSWFYEKSTYLEGLKQQYPDVKLTTRKELSQVRKTFVGILGSKNYTVFSTGIIAICALLKKYTKVYIYGFDWWKESQHHLGDSLTRGCRHDPSAEFYWLMRRIDEGVVVDLNPNSAFKHNVFQPAAKFEPEDK